MNAAGQAKGIFASVHLSAWQSEAEGRGHGIWQSNVKR